MEKELKLKIEEVIDYYYHYNPNTLKPLMLLTLAKKGMLGIVQEETQSVTACSIDPKELLRYDWVFLDESLKNTVEQWAEKEGAVSVEMDIVQSIWQIQQIFEQNDEIDVRRYINPRMGILVHHSDVVGSAKAHRQYATYVLAKTFIDAAKSMDDTVYFELYNKILTKSNIQPGRPREVVAKALANMLKYDGKGLIYNPFAGCSLASALLKPKAGCEGNYYGDAPKDEKQYAVGLLLNWGMGISNDHFVLRDSKQWLKNKKIDYVLSTYTGYVEDGVSAFEYCLKQCMCDNDFRGRYAGMVPSKEIFEKDNDGFKQAINRDWIDTIMVLPFGETAVLVNADKENEKKGKIRLINMLGFSADELKDNVELYSSSEIVAKVINVEDVKKDGCKVLRSKIESLNAEQSVYDIVTMGDLVSKIERKVFNFNDIKETKKYVANIVKSDFYKAESRNESIHFAPINRIFDPAYKIEKLSLLVNRAQRIFLVEHLQRALTQNC